MNLQTATRRVDERSESCIGRSVNWQKPESTCLDPHRDFGRVNSDRKERQVIPTVNEMTRPMFSRVAVSFLLVTASSAAPWGGGGGGGYAAVGRNIDLGALNPIHAPGGFVGRLGVRYQDVLQGGVEEEGYRRVGVGPDPSQWDEATLASLSAPDISRQAANPHDIGAQEVDLREAGPQDIHQLEAHRQVINPEEIYSREGGPYEIGLQQIKEEEEEHGPIPEADDVGKVISANYASSFHNAGIPWRNCVSTWDPRCRRPVRRPNPWFLF